MEHLGIPAGIYTKKSHLKKDRKRVEKADQQASVKNKKRREAEKRRQTQREEALREAEGETYGRALFND